jgi:hypothetical protein
LYTRLQLSNTRSAQLNQPEVKYLLPNWIPTCNGPMPYNREGAWIGGRTTRAAGPQHYVSPFPTLATWKGARPQFIILCIQFCTGNRQVWLLGPDKGFGRAIVWSQYLLEAARNVFCKWSWSPLLSKPQHIMKSISTSLGLLSGFAKLIHGISSMSGSNFAYGTAGKLIHGTSSTSGSNFQVAYGTARGKNCWNIWSRLKRGHKAPAKLQLNAELVSPFIYQPQHIMKSISTSLGLLSGFAIVIIATPVPSTNRALSPATQELTGLFHYSLLQ